LSLPREVTAVNDQIFRLTLPVTFAPFHVNGYLVKGTEGWAIVDTGMPTPLHLQVWQAALSALSVQPDQLREIYITHSHIDHFGLADQLQRMTGAPIFMLPIDIAAAVRRGEEAQRHREGLAKLYLRHGAPQEMVAEVIANLRPIGDGIAIPAEIRPLSDGEIVSLGGSPYKVIWTPGHSDGQYCLYAGQSETLFAADHLLPTVVPHVMHTPSGSVNPLSDYLWALDRISPFVKGLVLPGHGSPFSDGTKRIADLRSQYDLRFNKIETQIEGTTTAWEISRLLFPRAGSIEQKRWALGVTIAHMEYMASLGRLIRADEEPVSYKK
jgi:glyoxylase-like metal-dependent hydrolase (beta-lactamase superfamily II)